MDSNCRVTPDLLVGLTPPDIQLDVPDMDRKRQERRIRTQNAMKTHNPTLAKGILPECDNRTVEDIAATRIQASYRGHLGRKKYLEELYKLYEKEEAMRLEKTLEQVEEGQLLVENHQLEVQLDDNSTTWRNKSRQYLSKVITIQRAWRRYKTKGSQGAAQDGHGANVDNDANMSPALSETDEPTDASDSSNGQQAMSVSSPEEGDLVILKDCCGLDGKDWFRDVDSPPHGGTASTASAPVIEPEPDSSVSDYSEMAEPIKEHLANVQIIQKEDLEVGNTIYPSQAASNQKIAREPNETDEEFTKRVRKINYLSLAQEFAALKKIDATALPFDMHKVQTKELSSPMSDSSATETDSSERCYPESAEASNAATPIEGFGDLLPNDNSGVQRRSTDPTGADVDNLSEQFYGAKVTSNQTQQSAPSGGGKANRGEVGGGSEMLDNELNRKLANGSSRSGNNDAFHEQNATEKKTSAGYTQADFDVYNIESTLPQMDWDLLEEQLHRAAEEERQKKESRRNDREEIRRKLAMAGADEEYYGGERLLKRPNLQTRLQSGMNLQICFMNEASAEGDPQRAGGTGRGNSSNPAGVQAPGRTAPPNDKEAYAVHPPGGSTSVTTHPVNPSSKASCKDEDENEDDETEEDFFTRQARLQAEARMALAQVRPMARMQLEVEKQMRKKSPIAEIVGIPGFGDGKRRKLGLHLLQQMNLAQLQVVVNDLHGQIASLNEELVKLLVERDDLHMAQDSMLVDIEDLTRYCAAKSAAVGHRNVLAK